MPRVRGKHTLPVLIRAHKVPTSERLPVPRGPRGVLNDNMLELFVDTREGENAPQNALNLRQNPETR